MDKRLLQFVKRVLKQMKDNGTSAFSTEREQSTYLSKLVNEYNGFDYSIEYEMGVEYLTKYKAKLDPLSIDYAVNDSMSFNLEINKKRGTGLLYYFLEHEIQGGNEYKNDNNVNEYVDILKNLLYKIGDLNKVRPELRNFEESKWTADNNKELNAMLEQGDSLEEISNRLNKSIYDIVTHLFQKRKILNFELAYFVSIFRLALDDLEFYSEIYNEYNYDFETWSESILSI